MSGNLRSAFGARPGADRRTVVSSGFAVVGIVLAGTTLVALGGSYGQVAAVALVVAWVALPVEYALAAGQVALVVGASPPILAELVIGVEAGMGLVLLGALWTAADSPLPVLAWAIGFVGLAGAIWYAAAAWSVWQAALLLWVVLTIGGYGLHRHELVTLGLTEGTRQR